MGADIVRILDTFDNRDWVLELQKRLAWDASKVGGADTAKFAIDLLIDIATEFNAIPYGEKVPDWFLASMTRLSAYYDNRLKDDMRSLNEIKGLINDLS